MTSSGFSFSTGVIDTLGNYEWIKNNHENILNLFPRNWKLAEDVNFVSIRFQMKLLGIDYRSEDEFLAILVFLERTQFIHRHKQWIRRGTNRYLEEFENEYAQKRQDQDRPKA